MNPTRKQINDSSSTSSFMNSTYVEEQRERGEQQREQREQQQQ